MLATISGDTSNVLNMQHVNLNSKRWDYSDSPGSGHKKMKGPAHTGHTSFEKPQPPPSLNRLGFLTFVKLNRSGFITFINTLRPKKNYCRFADDTFKRIFLNENVRISIKISLKFVYEGPINNNRALVQIIAWHRSGDKPLSEPMMVSLQTHICVTRPQWVK